MGSTSVVVVPPAMMPVTLSRPGLGASLLDGIVRDGAGQMLAAALQAEVVAYIESCQHEVDQDGHRLAVRNGYQAER